MKQIRLKDIVRHFDFLTCAELYIGDSDIPVWTGSMIYLHAAADSKEKREQFLKECEQDKDHKAIKKTKKAHKYMKYLLYTDSNGEAIGVKRETNKYGNEEFILTIYIKKPMEEI